MYKEQPLLLRGNLRLIMRHNVHKLSITSKINYVVLVSKIDFEVYTGITYEVHIKIDYKSPK